MDTTLTSKSGRTVDGRLVALLLVLAVLKLQGLATESTDCKLTVESAEELVMNMPLVIRSEAIDGCPEAELIDANENKATFMVRNPCTKAASGTIGSYNVALRDGTIRPNVDNAEPVDSPRLRRIRVRLLKQDCPPSK